MGGERHQTQPLIKIATGTACTGTRAEPRRDRRPPLDRDWRGGDGKAFQSWDRLHERSNKRCEGLRSR